MLGNAHLYENEYYRNVHAYTLVVGLFLCMYRDRSIQIYLSEYRYSGVYKLYACTFIYACLYIEDIYSTKICFIYIYICKYTLYKIFIEHKLN